MSDVVKVSANSKLGLGFSRAVRVGNMVFVSGCVGVDPATNSMVKGGVREQTKQTLDNIKAILESAGSSLDKVLKVTVYIKEGSYFKDMNEVYAQCFGAHKPARATVVVGFVKDDIVVEIDAVATTATQ